ncbi:MAG: hypothetical protein ACPGR2_17110 [Psychrobium sp.]
MVKYLTGVLALSLVMTGCGGSNSGSKKESEKMPNGVWLGSSTSQLGVTDHGLLGLIAPNGELRLFVSGGEHLSGNFKLNGDELSTVTTSFNAQGVLKDTAMAAGSYTSEKISLEQTKGGELLNTIELTYSALSDNTAMFSRLMGTYASEDQTTSLVFDDDGDITGSDTRGCVFNGSSSIPNDKINIYRISLRVESCGALDGKYTGLAYWRAHATNEPEGIRFHLDDGSRALSYFMNKV